MLSIKRDYPSPLYLGYSTICLSMGTCCAPRAPPCMSIFHAACSTRRRACSSPIRASARSRCTCRSHSRGITKRRGLVGRR